MVIVAINPLASLSPLDAMEPQTHRNTFFESHLLKVSRGNLNEVRLLLFKGRQVNSSDSLFTVATPQDLSVAGMIDTTRDQ